jgi:hypothetical protein
MIYYPILAGFAAGTCLSAAIVDACRKKWSTAILLLVLSVINIMLAVRWIA